MLGTRSRHRLPLRPRLDAVSPMPLTNALAEALADWRSLLPGIALWALALYVPLSLQLGRLEELVRQRGERREALAIAVQACVHLLALGGYALPVQSCCRTGAPLEPPLGDRHWHCSLLPGEGLALGALPGARVVLWSSELALLQRLPRPALPLRPSGELMGPEPVWLHLLELIEAWCGEHLGRSPRAFRLLRSGFESMPPSPPPLR